MLNYLRLAIDTVPVGLYRIRKNQVMKYKPLAGISVLGLMQLCLAACGPSAPPDSLEPTPSHRHITNAEIEGITADNAFAVVQQLRPQWLRRRGPTSVLEPEGELPTVYVDNMRVGDLAILNSIPVSEISEIRFITGPDATTRWGTGVTAGVIEIIRKKK